MQVLADPQKRQVYDQFGEDGLKGGIPTAGPGAPGGGGGGGGGYEFHFSPTDPEEIFKQVSAQSRSPPLTVAPHVHAYRHAAASKALPARICFASLPCSPVHCFRLFAALQFFSGPFGEDGHGGMGGGMGGMGGMPGGLGGLFSSMRGGRMGGMGGMGGMDGFGGMGGAPRGPKATQVELPCTLEDLYKGAPLS